jgi:hypothetical protein
MNKTDFVPNSFLGAMAVGFYLLTAPVTRLWYNRCGAKKSERDMSLPGDEVVSHPRLTYTRAISINAPAKSIWPWLVQIGQGRGGLYSYDGLENLVGCDIHSADRILPHYQKLQPGDCIDFGPAEKKFPGQVIVALEPERYLLMHGMDPNTRKADQSATWVFVLDEQADGSTRFIVRARNGYVPNLTNHLVWHIVEPIAFVMERRMLRGIKRRAELYARSSSSSSSS